MSERATSGLSASIKRRLLRFPVIARGNQVRRRLAAQYQAVTNDLRYADSDQIFNESLDRKELFRRAFQALAYNCIKGDYAEFGCFSASTFTLAWGAAQLVGHPAHLWAFDSFEGLPPSTDPRDAHDGWVEGAMSMTESLFVDRCLERGLPRDAFTTVAGYYSDSLAKDAPGDRPETICFAYIDCDLYTSTRDVLSFLGPRLCNGAVVAFDDYFCFSETHSSGERLAAAEYFAEHPRWRLVPYVQWGWHGMSFMVEDRTGAPVTGFSGF